MPGDDSFFEIFSDKYVQMLSQNPARHIRRTVKFSFDKKWRMRREYREGSWEIRSTLRKMAPQWEAVNGGRRSRSRVIEDSSDFTQFQLPAFAENWIRAALWFIAVFKAVHLFPESERRFRNTNERSSPRLAADFTRCWKSSARRSSQTKCQLPGKTIKGGRIARKDDKTGGPSVQSRTPEVRGNNWPIVWLSPLFVATLLHGTPINRYRGRARVSAVRGCNTVAK